MKGKEFIRGGGKAPDCIRDFSTHSLRHPYRTSGGRRAHPAQCNQSLTEPGLGSRLPGFKTSTLLHPWSIYNQNLLCGPDPGAGSHSQDSWSITTRIFKKKVSQNEWTSFQSTINYQTLGYLRKYIFVQVIYYLPSCLINIQFLVISFRNFLIPLIQRGMQCCLRYRLALCPRRSLVLCYPGWRCQAIALLPTAPLLLGTAMDEILRLPNTDL